MNYPFLGYNTPGLQLGQPQGLSGMSNYQYNGPTLNASGNMAALGANPTFQGLGSSLGSINQPSWFNRANNWAANNADLIGSGINLVTGGIGAWQGMQQNKLLQSQMNQQAGQFREQMNLSKQNINRNLEDRQRARVASNPTAYESVESYMDKYRIK